jgi:hypothetical protein
MSPVKKSQWESATASHMSLMNTLKRRVPKTDPFGTPDRISNGEERREFWRRGSEICGLIDNCEIS